MNSIFGMLKEYPSNLFFINDFVDILINCKIKCQGTLPRSSSLPALNLYQYEWMYLHRCFKGTAVNRTCHSINEIPLEVTLTVPLNVSILSRYGVASILLLISIYLILQSLFIFYYQSIWSISINQSINIEVIYVE